MAQLNEGKQYWELLDPNSKGCRRRIKPSSQIDLQILRLWSLDGASSRAARVILAILRLARISLTSHPRIRKWRPWFATKTSHACRVDEMSRVA